MNDSLILSLTICFVYDIYLANFMNERICLVYVKEILNRKLHSKVSNVLEISIFNVKLPPKG